MIHALKGPKVLKKLNEVVVSVQSVLQRQLVSSEKQKHFMDTPP